ncbi:MAG: M23 family metallopeptidase [Candidatus Omnitrophica bacterium]|nr:M23 family metallopeptidase [Candidatus Omnitrophota bacterium]
MSYGVAATEARFVLPTGELIGGKLQIRSDSRGSGHFLARRSGGRRKHLGVDLAAPMGSPVIAGRSGWARSIVKEDGYGKYVEIHHMDGYWTRYAHLDSLSLPEIAWVHQGDLIGTVGNTGNASHPQMIPHLHFEVRLNERILNPEKGILQGLEAYE